MRNSQFSVPKRKPTKGFLKEEDFKALDRLADEILNKHKEYNHN